MLSLLKSELFRSRKRAQTWITIAIVAIGTVLYFGGFVIADLVGSDGQAVRDTLQVANADEEGLLILSLLGAIVGVVFGAGLIGSEYSWNTMRSLVARSRTRAALLGAKWLTVAVYVLALVVITVVAAYASATVGAVIAGNDASWSASTVGELLRAIGLNWIAIAPSVALAVFAAVLTRSNAAAIAIGIAAIFVEPILFGLVGALSDSLESVQKAGISFNASRVTSYAATGESASTFSQFLVSALVLILWLLAFVFISTRVFIRRDVKSG